LLPSGAVIFVDGSTAGVLLLDQAFTLMFRVNQVGGCLDAVCAIYTAGKSLHKGKGKRNGLRLMVYRYKFQGQCYLMPPSWLACHPTLLSGTSQRHVGDNSSCRICVVEVAAERIAPPPAGHGRHGSKSSTDRAVGSPKVNMSFSVDRTGLSHLYQGRQMRASGPLLSVRYQGEPL
jgi:hypothetical protein